MQKISPFRLAGQRFIPIRGVGCNNTKLWISWFLICSSPYGGVDWNAKLEEIETRYHVHPHTRVRVEIMHQVKVDYRCIVHPHTGMWIKIAIYQINNWAFSSCPRKWNMGWNFGFPTQATANGSSPHCRGVGCNYLITRPFKASRRSSPYGVVSWNYASGESWLQVYRSSPYGGVSWNCIGVNLIQCLSSSSPYGGVGWNLRM